MLEQELSGLEVNALYNSMIKSSDSSLYIYLPLASNSVLDTIANNYAGKTFNLPIKQSKVENEIGLALMAVNLRKYALRA